MELKINIDETQFKDVMEKELKALTPDQLAEIFKETIKQYLLSDNAAAIKNLFIDRNYSYGSSSTKPTALTQKIVEKIDFKQELDPVVQEIKNELLGNSRNILESVMIKAMAKSIADCCMREGWFEQAFVAMHHYEYDKNQQT